MDKRTAPQDDSATIVTELFVAQVFRYRAWTWNASQADHIAREFRVGGVNPQIIINPQEWAWGIRHDVDDFGPDPAPHDAPRTDWMDEEFSIQIDKRYALTLTPSDCLRPGVAVPSPLYPAPAEERYLIIDGWHRIYRAYTLGWTEFPIYALNRPAERGLRVILPGIAWGVE